MTPAPLVPWDSFDSTFVGSTNNVATRLFYINGLGGQKRLVATMTFTYLNSGAANDDTVKSLTTTYPAIVNTNP